MFFFSFLPIVHQNVSFSAGFMLLVGINILHVVCEQISEQMGMLSFETVRGSFHGVECRGSKKGEFFSFLNNIQACFSEWVSSLGAFECFILEKMFKVRVTRLIQFDSISKL